MMTVKEMIDDCKRLGYNEKTVMEYLGVTSDENNEPYLETFRKYANLIGIPDNALMTKRKVTAGVCLSAKIAIEKLTASDLQAIANIQRIAINARFMAEYFIKSKKDLFWTFVNYPMGENINVIEIRSENVIVFATNTDDKNAHDFKEIDGAFADYIEHAQRLYVGGKISSGKYEQILLEGFRADLVYGV